jgi:SulP family sulfate permease
VKNFQELFDPANDPDQVVLEFQHSKVMDHSAIEAVDGLTERYLRAGKRLSLRHLSGECRGLLEKARHLVEVNVVEDPSYHVADDRLG